MPNGQDENWDLKLELVGKHGERIALESVTKWLGLDFAQFTILENTIVSAVAKALKDLGDAAIELKKQQG